MVRVVWDLNPRKFLRFNGFQGRRFRPLSQPPKTGVRHSTECAAPRAPRGIRTHTVQILSPLPLPIGLEEPAPPHEGDVCSRLESNQGPPDLQSGALPTELQEPARHKPFLVYGGYCPSFLANR